MQIARDYNRRIARYSELATPGQVGAERLTGMLIKRRCGDGHKSSMSAPPPNRQSNKPAGAAADICGRRRREREPDCQHSQA